MLKVKRLLILLLLMICLFFTGCNYFNNSATASVLKNDEYEYTITNNEVTLVNYLGEYRALIEVPEYIDGVNVTKIQQGCFKKNNIKSKFSVKRLNASQEDEDNELSENSTYVIGDNITDIDNDSFDENSTFVTSNKTKPEGWAEEKMDGSAKEGTGNVYYNTAKDETIVSGGIVYVKHNKLNGLYVARCLTQREEVIIPSTVDGEAVIDVGRYAFWGNNKIEKVVLPKSIGNVYSYAFVDCANLKEVIFNSENLSRLMSYSFKGCLSLDVVELPLNCTYLGEYAFSDCGTISLLNMPASLGSISYGAFTNTTIEKIIYGGTEEQWNLIKTDECVLGVLNNAQIQFDESQEVVQVTRLRDIYSLPYETIVEFTGIITGFYNQKGIFVTDPEDNYSIFCFNANGISISDLDYIGKTVKVRGLKTFYIGQLEIYNCELEVLDEPKTDIEPIELDLTESNLNLEEYINLYVVVKGTVENISGRYIYLNGGTTFIYYHYLWAGSPSIKIGDNIEVSGWVYTYNTTIHIMIDSRIVRIVN